MCQKRCSFRDGGYLLVLATNVITRQVPTIPPLRYRTPRTPDSGTALPLRFADYLVSDLGLFRF